MIHAGRKKMPARDHSQAGQEKGALRHEEDRLVANPKDITAHPRVYSGMTEKMFRHPDERLFVSEGGLS